MMISRYCIVPAMMACLVAIRLPAGDDDNRPNVPSTQPLKDTNHQKLGLASNLCRVSDVIGKKVENEQGESLGKIEDVVLDAGRGQIVYAVLSFGGILGIGDKLFAIPWTALKDQPGKKSCLLSVDKEKLKKAPGFDKSKWPDLGDSKWSQGLDEFYGVQRPVVDHGRRLDLNFGEAGLKREAAKLPLELKQGQSFRYFVESHPLSDVAPEGPRLAPASTTSALESRRESPAVSSAFADMELSFKVVKIQAGEATIESTCQALNAPVFSSARKDESSTGKHQSCTFLVRKDGQVVFPAKEEGGTGVEKKSADSSNAHVRAHLDHIFGYRLHDSGLEPGKEYTMPASVHELLGHTPGGSAAHHRMRYEGVTTLEGNQTARFAILPGAPKAGSGADGSDSGSVRAIGRAAYRLDDGLLERLAMGSTSIRRISLESGNAGN